MFGGRLVSRTFEEIQQTASNPNQNSAALWRIFSSHKSVSANSFVFSGS
jgi:hypothetical protein